MPLTPLAAPADGVLPLLVATRIRVHIHQKATPGVVGHRVHDDRRVGACRGRAGQVVDVRRRRPSAAPRSLAGRRYSRKARRASGRIPGSTPVISVGNLVALTLHLLSLLSLELYHAPVFLGFVWRLLHYVLLRVSQTQQYHLLVFLILIMASSAL